MNLRLYPIEDPLPMVPVIAAGTVERCTGCGFNHTDVKFLGDSVSGYSFECLLSKTTVNV